MIDASDSNYFDWNNSFDVIKKAYESSLFVLIIGPKGTGKTSLVRKFAADIEKTLYSINFSLRTRESHLVGTKTMNQGEVTFVEGILIKSMRDGGILYLDELNAAEADVLLRLDEALDDRRQIVLKEAEGQVINALDNWFVFATINPLSHEGTKELPPQLLSRFPVRLRLEYPPKEIEKQIIKQHVHFDTSIESDIDNAFKLANSLREAAALEELFYSPSIRESIAFAKMIKKSVPAKQAAQVVYANVYEQWGDVEYRKVMEMITSIFA